MSVAKSRRLVPPLAVLAWFLMGCGSASAAPEMTWPTLEEVREVLTLENHNTRIVVLSTALLGIASGLVGTFLLLRRRSLMGDALSHATQSVGNMFQRAVYIGWVGQNVVACFNRANLACVPAPDIVPTGNHRMQRPDHNAEA